MFVLKISQEQFNILDFYFDFVALNLTGSSLSFRVSVPSKVLCLEVFE